MDDHEVLRRFSLGIIERGEFQLDDIFTKETSSNIAIYKNNYLQGHLKHLKSVYPVCSKILGENNFNFFMSQYLSLVPPSSENLNEYGQVVDEFLSKREELGDLFYITYIATLEWTIYEQVKSEIKLPNGIHSLWSAITNDLSTENIEIDENESELIKFE